MGRHRDCRCLFFLYITTITTTSIVIIVIDRTDTNRIIITSIIREASS